MIITLVLAAISALLGGHCQAAPLKVFILAGQSNMQGHAKISTFEHIGMDPATKPLLDAMVGADGKSKVCERVWISSIGCAGDDTTEQTGRLTAGFGATTEKIGPEFTFGLAMEGLTDGPIVLIKTSWGGKSLNTDFRPPSAGPYVFNDTQVARFRKEGKDIEKITAEKIAATGVYYRLMIEHVRKVLADLERVAPGYDAAQGHDIVGFVWFQGWNDMVDQGTYPNRDKPGGYDAYTTVLTHFIRDVRRDLGVPKLPFVIGVLGVGGPTAEYPPEQMRHRATHDNFRAAMAAPAELPEFQDNVVAIRTEKYWDRELTLARAKENEARAKAKALAKEQKLNPAEERALMEGMRAESLTERERVILEKGVSNAEYHYLGCAKILGGIGKGLAEAMAGLIEP